MIYYTTVYIYIYQYIKQTYDNTAVCYTSITTNCVSLYFIYSYTVVVLIQCLGVYILFDLDVTKGNNT